MTASRRDLRLDSLRGLLLVCMALNHVPSDVHGLTDRSLGLFSAAEGFVFLSGLLAGMVYTRRMREYGAAALREIASRRATAIYAWHLAAYLCCLIIVQATDWLAGTCSFTAPQLFHADPLLALGLGMLMLHQPGWLDILPMYCALVLLLPWVLPALENGRRFRVIGASFVVWLVVQAAPAIDGAPLAPLHFGSFNLFAWQFLFILGVAVGHDRVATAQPPAASARLRPFLTAGAIGIGVYAWGLHHLQWAQPWPDTFFGILLNKPALGALRLGDFLLVAYLVSLLGAAWPRALQWRALAFVGRHSLAVVAVQSVAVMAMMQFPALFRDVPARAGSNGALLAIVFGTAWMAERRKQRRLVAAPAGARVQPRLAAPAIADQPYGIRTS